jgi:hypothetical protein
MRRCRPTHPRTTSFFPFSPASAVFHISKRRQKMIESSSLTQAIAVVMLRSSQVPKILSTFHFILHELTSQNCPSGFSPSQRVLVPIINLNHTRLLSFSASCGMMAAHVVGPVVQALRELVHPASCIWWRPTAEFTLLPLHASGLREDNNL